MFTSSLCLSSVPIPRASKATMNAMQHDACHVCGIPVCSWSTHPDVAKRTNWYALDEVVNVPAMRARSLIYLSFELGGCCARFDRRRFEFSRAKLIKRVVCNDTIGTASTYDRCGFRIVTVKLNETGCCLYYRCGECAGAVSVSRSHQGNKRGGFNFATVFAIYQIRRAQPKSAYF